MADKVDPRWVRFGRELLRIRSSSGMTQRRLADRMSIHYTTLGKIERAERTPQWDQVEQLEQLLETGGVLSRIWHESNRQDHVPDWFKGVLPLESRALEIRAYESTVMPGILQIPDYARSLVDDRMITASSSEKSEIVSARCRRLGRALEGGSPLLWFIVKESVLLDLVGSEDIMRRQLQHLVQLAEEEVIRLQLLPTAVRTSIGMCLPFWIYRLDQGRTIAYAEHVKGGEIIDSYAGVEDFRTLFGQLQAEALPPGQSVALIRKMLENRYGDVEEEQL